MKLGVGLSVGWILYFGILLGDFGRARFSQGGMYDLDILLRAAERSAHGENPYQLSDRDEHTKPPIVMPLLTPLFSVPRQTLYWCWGMGSLALFFLCQYWLGVREFGWQTLFINFSLLSFLLPEVRGGQTNCLLLALLIAEWRFRPKGICLALAICLKPTCALFLPFFVGQGRWKLAAQALGWVALGAVLYGASNSFGNLWQDHITWLKFICVSTKRHLSQFDNLGIPAVLGNSWICLLATLPLMFWFGRRSQFELACWASVVFSPMAWLQNYIFLLPTLVRVSKDAWPKGAWHFWGIFFVATQLINYDTVGPRLYEMSLQYKLPLWASFVLVYSLDRRTQG